MRNSGASPPVAWRPDLSLMVVGRLLGGGGEGSRAVNVTGAGRVLLPVWGDRGRLQGRDIGRGEGDGVRKEAVYGPLLRGVASGRRGGTRWPCDELSLLFLPSSSPRAAVALTAPPHTYTRTRACLAVVVAVHGPPTCCRR